MIITWDAEAKAVYIYLPRVRKRKPLKTVPLDGYESIYLDYNTDAELVGIEILNVDTEPYLKHLIQPKDKRE